MKASSEVLPRNGVQAKGDASPFRVVFLLGSPGFPPCPNRRSANEHWRGLAVEEDVDGGPHGYQERGR